MSFRHAHAIANLVLSTHNFLRQYTSNAKEYERSPLPSERVDGYAEDEPVDEFGVCEEVESSSRCFRLEKRCHVDPSFHPILLRPSQRVHEKHQEQSSIYADVIVSNRPDRVDVRAVVTTNADVPRWEDLKVPFASMFLN